MIIQVQILVQEFTTITTNQLKTKIKLKIKQGDQHIELNVSILSNKTIKVNLCIQKNLNNY